MTAGISYVSRLPAHAPCDTTKVHIIKQLLQWCYHQGRHHLDWLHTFHAAMHAFQQVSARLTLSSLYQVLNPQETRCLRHLMLYLATTHCP